jgi:tetratricopeptide (TPR) repeat protein
VDSTSETLAQEVARLYQSGNAEPAFLLALEAVRRYPDSSLAHTNLGYFFVLRGEPAQAIAAYESALRANASNPEARRGLAVAKTQAGIAAQGDALSVVPYRGTGRAIDVLVPITLGTGNVVTGQLFDDRVFRVTKLAVELQPPDAALPEHDVVFNAVGEADSSAQALEKLRGLLARSTKRVLNRPALVERTGRLEQAQRLRDLDDVIAPRIDRVERSRVRELAFPILLRSPGYHAGEHFVCVDDAGAVDAALETLPGETLFAIEFLDTRDDRGTFAKYRVMAVDGAIYPLHLAISPHWNVHYFSAEMAAHEAYRLREAQFLSDPQVALGSRAYAALQRIVATLGLDYAGIDFALDPFGRVVVFECNAVMAAYYPAEVPLWAYRRPAVDAVLGAVREMLIRYSSS